MSVVKVIRSCIAYLWLALALVICLPFRASVNKQREEDFSKSQARMWSFASWVGKMGCRTVGVKLTVKGVENVPKDGSVVFVGNHQSMFDAPVMLAAIPRPSSFIVKEELKKVPVFSGWIEAMNCFFLPRGESRKSLEIIIAASKLLKQHDHGMVIFPEGTRSSNGDMRAFKPGSLKIATRSGAAIVPFAIEHSIDVMPRGSVWMKKNPVTVTFLPAIPAEEVKGKDTTELTRGIVKDIAAIVGSPVPSDDAPEEQQAV